MRKIYVIMGSTRAGRLCSKISGWVTGIAQETPGFALELVDLADWPLPMDDEPGIPAMAVYQQEHTRAWSRKIAAAEAIIFVTPQYNWGYPAPLKNAIDHLYGEWRNKPAVIVTYGGHGGGKCAVQLRQVLEAIGMRPTATMPGITLTQAMVIGGPVEPETDFAADGDKIRRALAELSAALAQ